jgi:hypothetical protein
MALALSSSDGNQQGNASCGIPRAKFLRLTMLFYRIIIKLFRGSKKGTPPFFMGEVPFCGEGGISFADPCYFRSQNAKGTPLRGPLFEFYFAYEGKLSTLHKTQKAHLCAPFAFIRGKGGPHFELLCL